MSKRQDDESVFEGFEQANTTPVPDVFFDKLLSKLTGAEVKVLLYIIRRTAGFKKTEDAISLTQFEKGIITREGKRLDCGCGIKRRQTIVDALASLEKKGYIVSHKTKTSQGDDATTVYQIHFKGVVSKPDYPSELEGSFKTVPPSFKTGLGVVAETVLPVVSKPDPQETVIQQTDNLSIDRATPVANPPIDLSSLSDQDRIAYYSEEIRKIEEKNLEHFFTLDVDKLELPVEKQTSSVSPIVKEPTKNTEPKTTRNTRKTRDTEPLQKSLPEAPLSEKAQHVWRVWLQMPWNKGIPPKLTPKAIENCELLASVEITQEIIFKVLNYAKKNDNNGFYNGKAWELGHVVREYPRWNSTVQEIPEIKEAPKSKKKMTDAERNALPL